MEVQRFEQAILKMAFETDARITTASVAYYLGIPSREANRLLNQLLEEGVLELDSDADGNLYYQVPNGQNLHAPPPRQETDRSWQELEAAADLAAGRSPAASPREPQPARQATPSPVPAPLDPARSPFGATLDDAVGAPAFSPLQHPDAPLQRYPDAARAPLHRSHTDVAPPGGTSRQSSLNYGVVSSRRDRPTLSHREGYDGGLRSTERFSATSNTGCDANSVIVDAAASCEPKPLANQRATVVSCTGYEASPYAQPESSPFGFAVPRPSTALAPAGAGELALSQANALDQPEHQPGMALLLSLILCGTGQIYNGEVSKGIIMMVLCILLWLVLLGWVVHIWSIVDAVVVAERINRQSSP
ncbi:hypothetical protein [Lujinxingia sediminis]|uniref:hypothetical protein n=1 Tax=Lujinxingia sediminis TaxID=2480984 RepID=UPI0019CFE795|nr:hypothetical protein [Lujinxingia sediminis]